MTPKDRDEYERIKQGIIRAIQKSRPYISEFDNLQIELIAGSMVYWRKGDPFLDSNTATPETYSRVIDGKVKLAKTIEEATQKLGITRHERIITQTQGNSADNPSSDLAENRLNNEEHARVVADFVNSLPRELRDPINAYLKKQTKPSTTP